MKIEEISKEKAEVEIINSIKSKHKAIRQAAKSPCFALTYSGTWHTLVKNCGLTKEKAIEIEKAYHELYKVSDQYVKKQIEKASYTGYVEGCFGLKARTPKLRQSILGLKVTPKEVEAESRTAGNMLSQSFGMLTPRALHAFMEKVRNSPYRTKIRCANIIHDALYFLVDDDIDTILWLNENLVKEFQWQDEPKIKHDKVHLGGDVSIFYPSWKDELSIPNNCSREELLSLVQKYQEELNNG